MKKFNQLTKEEAEREWMDIKMELMDDYDIDIDDEDSLEEVEDEINREADDIFEEKYGEDNLDLAKGLG